jgi:hypothetical protein
MKIDETLLRLRAANPVAHADAADGAEELFARITATRRDGALRRHGYRRPAVALAVAFIAAAVLASTAFAISQWLGGDVVRPNVTAAEYRAAQRQLPLPPGVTWPALRVVPNSVTTRGGGGGHAVVIAQNAWECYWVQAIGRRDAAAQARAHAMVEDLLRNRTLVAPVGAPEDWVPPNPPTGPYAVYAHDGGYEWVQQTYALAAAGQPARLAQRCRANSQG